MSVTAITRGGGPPDSGQATGLTPGWGVSPGRQQEIAKVLRGMGPANGRLSGPQLGRITAGLAARRDLWADLVVHDPDVRWYLPLHRSNACDVWLLAWERGQDRPELARIRMCAGCTLLFVDRSRPGTRRWCSMERCGNRSKTAHYRQKRRT